VFAQNRENDLPDPIPKTPLRYQQVIAGEHWLGYFWLWLWKNQHLSRWDDDLDLLWLGLDAVQPVPDFLVMPLPVLYRKFSTR
jgi:hypothetical protein